MEKTYVRGTWFGLNATVTIDSPYLHRAGFGSVRIPHPPVANWVLRAGLPDERRYSLMFSHEFGHFQTAPLALLYSIALIVFYIRRVPAGLPGVIVPMLSVFSFWEMISEIYTIVNNRQGYREAYKRVSVVPRYLFWVVTSLLVLAGWAFPFR